MDISRFGEGKTGQLVRMSSLFEDWAFIPDPLFPKWEFPIGLWPLLAAAKEKLGELNGIGRTLDNPQLLFRPLCKREALRSSSLEGTYATPEQLLLFEMNPKTPKSPSDKLNEFKEVFNYDNTIKLGFKSLSEQDFSLMMIRQLHAELLSGVRGADAEPGRVRSRQIHIGSDRRFVPPPPHALNECLEGFIKSVATPDSRYDPLVAAFLVHYQFETIHPFNDGNGRLGRVLLSLMICKWCGHKLPWLYLSAYFERYKDEYFDHLFDISANGHWEKWVEFCLRGTIQQSEDAITRCALLQNLKRELHRKVDGGSPRTHPMIDDLFFDSFITVTSVAKKYGVTYPTAKSDIEKLVKAGVLRELPNLRPRTYYSNEMMRIAYSDSL